MHQRGSICDNIALSLFAIAAVVLTSCSGDEAAPDNSNSSERARGAPSLPSTDETPGTVEAEPLDPARYPEAFQPSGEAFRLACNQCHVLPDPRRHTAAEWRAVVARMQQNMQWMNRVVGSRPIPGEPQLRVEEINAFLAKYARR